jgi:hypothetical protein
MIVLYVRTFQSHARFRQCDSHANMHTIGMHEAECKRDRQSHAMFLKPLKRARSPQS